MSKSLQIQVLRDRIDRPAIEAKPEYQNILRLGDSLFSECEEPGSCCVCMYRGRSGQEAYFDVCTIKVRTIANGFAWDDRLMCPACADLVLITGRSSLSRVATIVEANGPEVANELFRLAIEAGIRLSPEEFKHHLSTLIAACRVQVEKAEGLTFYSACEVEVAPAEKHTQTKAEQIIALVRKYPGKTKKELVDLAPHHIKSAIHRDYIGRLAKCDRLICWDDNAKQRRYYHPDHGRQAVA